MRSILLLTYLTISMISFGQTYEVEEVQLIVNFQTINGINDKSDDFCPIVMGNEIYFTSSRQYNKHTVGENNWDKNSYLNIFYGTIRNDAAGTIDVKDVKLLSNKLNSGTHTGPMSLSPTGDTLFFTQVVTYKKVSRSHLFTAVRKKNGWGKIKAIPFCTTTSSYGHPSYDAKNKRLYFASDMPGGKGGNDIYYSELQSGEWTIPVNVATINTEHEEKFPFVNDDNIFYSSDKPGGKGGLDIYYQSKEVSDYPIKLMGINSEFDDFGITVSDNFTSGYLSSNPNGNDDIRYFTIEKKLTLKNELSGSFTFRSLSGTPSNLSVKLYNGEGDFVYEEKTDENGHFVFNNVMVDSSFTVRLGEVANEEMTLDIYDENGNPSASFLLSEEGTFKYKKLFYDSGGIISFLPEDMINEEKRTATLSGKLVLEHSPSQPLESATVNLLDINRNIAVSSTTDKNGNFNFDNLDIDQEYYIQVPSCTDELLLYIYNASDAIFTQLKCNSEDNFMYRRLRPEKGNSLSMIRETKEEHFMLNSSEIIGQFERLNGDDSPVECLVSIYSENGRLLETTETDSLGNFHFNNLSSENTYKFTADIDEPLQLTLYNRYAKQVAKMQQEDENYFIFRPLGYQAETNLSLIEDNVTFDLNILEKYRATIVYFNTNQSSVKNSVDVKKLNALLTLLKKHPNLRLSVSAYADATASEEYNFTLSQKRGDWIVSYLVKKGIDKNRLTVNAYGETKLVDPENDDLNRRAELRMYR